MQMFFPVDELLYAGLRQTLLACINDTLAKDDIGRKGSFSLEDMFAFDQFIRCMDSKLPPQQRELNPIAVWQNIFEHCKGNNEKLEALKIFAKRWEFEEPELKLVTSHFEVSLMSIVNGEPVCSQSSFK